VSLVSGFKTTQSYRRRAKVSSCFGEDCTTAEFKSPTDTLKYVTLFYQACVGGWSSLVPQLALSYQVCWKEGSGAMIRRSGPASLMLYT
jgi:hypothetical protein